MYSYSASCQVVSEQYRETGKALSSTFGHKATKVTKLRFLHQWLAVRKNSISVFEWIVFLNNGLEVEQKNVKYETSLMHSHAPRNHP